MAEFQRKVTFRPGYNYLHETGPKRRGQHGMEIHFTLVGEAGAVDVGFSTGWTPLGDVDQDRQLRGRDPMVHTDFTDPWGFGVVRPPSGICVGIHRPTPFPHDPEAEFLNLQDCDILPGGKCYWDGSFTASDPILKSFIEKGEEPVWEALEGWYRRVILLRGGDNVVAISRYCTQAGCSRAPASHLWDPETCPQPEGVL